EKVEVTKLILENPMAEEGSVNLRVSQKQKGLPTPVFNFARNRMMDFFRAGGFKTITAVPENYAVSLLYRRFVQFSPSSQSAIDRYQYVDKLFQYARSSLPEDVRVRSADDFSKILGGPSDRIPDSLIEVEDLWLDRWKKKMPKELVPFGDSQGNLLGLIDRRRRDAKPAIYFFDPSDPNGYFLRWSSLVEKVELDLQKKLN
ncbi:MAG: SMI1/KNR4 family protein, partial [Bdellovibrionia bacterium]